MLTIDANVFVSANSTAEIQHGASVAFFSRVLQKLLLIRRPSLVVPETAAAILRSTNNIILARSIATSISQLQGLSIIPLNESRAAQAGQRKPLKSQFLTDCAARMPSMSLSRRSLAQHSLPGMGKCCNALRLQSRR